MTPVPMNAIESGADMMEERSGEELRNSPRMQELRRNPRDTFFACGIPFGVEATLPRHRGALFGVAARSRARRRIRSRRFGALDSGFTAADCLHGQTPL
jgi:hypothetical protein